MKFKTRTLSAQESRVVLALSERGSRETTRKEIVELLGARVKAADHVIESAAAQQGLAGAGRWGCISAYSSGPRDRTP